MDPYQVLGISRDATPEEIKKAYRQKAKQYHPDLHPDDPSCTEKMNQVNEAYDRLTHPEKYKDTVYSSQNSYGGYQNSQNSYGGYQNSQNNGYGGYQNSQNNGYGGYQNSQNRQQNNGYGGYGNGSPYQDFGDFWFGNMGGFYRTNMERPKPQPLNRDSQEIINVIYYINNGQYDQAIQILNSMVSTLRDDRWYYLSALANYERGQKVIALDQIQKAMQIAPYNQDYKQAYNYMNQVNVNYQNTGSSYTSVFNSMGSICLWYMMCQCFCMFCH